MKQEHRGEVEFSLLDRSLNSYLRRVFSFFYNIVFVILAHVIYLILAMILSVITSLVFPAVTSSSMRILLVFGPLIVLFIMSFRTARTRQTPGNRTVGIVVVDNSGTPLSFSRSVLRNALLVVFAALLGVGLLWSLFDHEGRGLHDRLIGTRLGNAPGAENYRIPVFGFVVFILAIICVIQVFFSFIALTPLWSSPDLLLMSLLLLLILAPVTFILSLIARWSSRKNPLSKTVTNTARSISIIAGIFVFFMAVTIPSNPLLQKVNAGKQCEGDIMEIGTAMEKYIRDRHTFPETFEELVSNNYLIAVPSTRRGEHYLYAMGFSTMDTVFIIHCPSYDGMLKNNGLYPTHKYVELKYVQNKGLIILTK